ncbi:MAG: hypothetical protein AB7S90_06990 [Marinobacterium sp.]
MTLAAQEQNRHRWLEALGVDSWLPRGNLPGAAEIAPWVESFCYSDDAQADAWLEDVAESVEEQAIPVSTPAPKPVTARARIDTDTLLDQRPAAVPKATPVERPVRTTPTSTVVEAPRFKLAFVLRQDLLIVDSLPPHQPQGFSRHHRALLTGITTALGAEADTELSDAMMLPWPMLASRTLDQGAEEARRAVQHKLRRTLESHRRITQVLLMGEAAAHWILGETAPLDTLQGRSFKLPSGLPVVVTLSLSELLRLPERKAEAWRDIQPLRLVRSSD